MSTSEYIESGVIESYVLGMLSDEEGARVEAMAEQHPEVKEVLQELKSTLGNIAMDSAVAPDPEWKDDILAAAFKEDTSAPVVRQLGAPSSGGSNRSSLYFLAVAASIALLFSLGLNIFQFQSLREMEYSLDTAEARLAAMESENQVMLASYNNMEEDMLIIRDRNTIACILKSAEGRDTACQAHLYWNSSTKKVYLDVKMLPQPPDGMQYQLWAMVDGEAVDMGVFDQGLEGEIIMEMGTSKGAESFAVTLEPAGGVNSPSMDEVYLYSGPMNVPS